MYDKKGPYELGHTIFRIKEGMVHVWFPKNHSAKSCVCFLNGTFAPSFYYRGLLPILATWGVNVLCPENSFTGNGIFGSNAMKSYIEKYPETKIGFSGHSQGGSGAVVAANLFGVDRVSSVFCIEPAWGMGRWKIKDDIGNIKSDAFVVQGGEDTSVYPWWLAMGLRYFKTKVYHGLAHKADHIYKWQPIVKPVFIAWHLWKLKGDEKAGEFIKALGESEAWDLNIINEDFDFQNEVDTSKIDMFKSVDIDWAKINYGLDVDFS